MSQSSADTPWTQGNLTVAMTAIDLVERYAEEAYRRGEEACGYLSGPAASPLHVDTAVELENLANRYHEVDPEQHPRTGREYFKINSRRFERALREARVAGRPAKVLFHSHLDCGAYFSEQDAASVTLGDRFSPAFPLAYLVTAVDQGQVSSHALFVWDSTSRRFVESRFAITEG